MKSFIFKKKDSDKEVGIKAINIGIAWDLLEMKLRTSSKHKGETITDYELKDSQG